MDSAVAKGLIKSRMSMSSPNLQSQPLGHRRHVRRRQPARITPLRAPLGGPLQGPLASPIRLLRTAPLAAICRLAVLAAALAVVRVAASKAVCSKAGREERILP